MSNDQPGCHNRNAGQNNWWSERQKSANSNKEEKPVAQEKTKSVNLLNN